MEEKVDKEKIENKFYLLNKEQEELIKLAKKVESENLPYSYGGSS